MALWKKSARDLAQMFATGEASAVEIVTEHLVRIDEVNPELNAVVARIDDQALETAAQIDEAKAQGQPLGPLAGVPFTIKVNNDLIGSATDYGIPVLKDAIPTVDEPCVERMKNAGAIPLARTNMPDLGLRMHTDSFLHGPTKNPWNPLHTTGGSSGGEGVALATGMSPIGLGNDVGGSLRNPATCCGIASIKPTLGRVPRAEQISTGPHNITMQLCATNGPMARNIEDVELGLKVISGVHPRDPITVPVPLNNPQKESGKIAVMATPPGGPTDPRVAQVVNDASLALEKAGVIVEAVDVPVYEDTLKCWTDIVVGTIADGLSELKPVISPSAFTFIQIAVNTYGPFTAERWQQGWADRFDLLVKWNAFFDEYDAVLTPTWTQLPLLAGQDGGNGSVEDCRYNFETCRPVYPGNVLGIPSVAVPAGLVDGLPVGVLINGPQWSDLRCLQLAKYIEDAGIAPPPRF
ncbi:MAG TPA: indole acetimide hydrolase [Hellea balneolensis]|uniref:Indole acetimide hydrolase n=1 Tax=Hellea balneolensis TaxID=287478 RepID=A0A7C5R7Z5_9PROT|nr:indole acetimide hydrolase [Hellea balneolensis]